MKKKFALLFLLPLLVSCGGETTTSSVSAPSENNSVSETSNSSVTPDSTTDSIPDSSEAPESEISSEENTATNVTFVYDMFPMPDGNGYPTKEEDKTVTADSTTIYTDSVMQGEGDYANLVQMKKEISYIYNTTPVYGTFRITIKEKANDYGNFTGVPTLYLGSEEHPTDSESISEYTTVENDGYLDYTFTTKVDGYFTLANESSYALLFTQFSIR